MVSFEDWWKAEGSCRCVFPVWGVAESRAKAVACVVWDAGRAALVAERTEIAPPALTRADILRWPETEDGRKRLREECASIVEVNLPSEDWYTATGIWRPDIDASQCKMVVDAMVKDGYRWATGVERDGVAWAEFHKIGVSDGFAPTNEPSTATFDWLTKTSLAACIAALGKE